MTRKKSGYSEIKIQKWIKDGRGSGRKHNYKPWLKVSDFSSQGRSHRIYGHKSQRTHHLFSDLELAVFLILEWDQSVTEIREQFPLKREETLELSNLAGILHPSFSGAMQYMSSDFLVNTSNKSRSKFVLQAKYVKSLSDPRTVEKLELERRYWDKKGVPWFLITEREIPENVFININWLYPAQRDEISISDLVERGQNYSHWFNKKPKSKVIDIAKSLDAAYDLALGDSLLEIRQLLAHRFFIFDIHKVFSKLTAADIKLAGSVSLLEDAYVSGK